VIDRVLPWTEIEQALEALARSEATGKIVMLIEQLAEQPR
jgi:hypothetical protein